MKYELIIAGSYYHIYNRGNNYEDIFKEEKNYWFFLDLMKKHLTEVADVLAYCLLKNHFHLIVCTKDNFEDKLISQKLSNLFNAYVKAINKAYQRNGSLFKDRFPRKRIESEEYLKNLILYVHLNPVHHGFIERHENYSYSSYRSQLSTKETLLNRDFVLGLFDGKENFKFCHQQRNLNIDQELTLE